MTAALDVEDVTLAFERIVAVQNVSLTVQPGEMLGLLGPNGSGKSSLLNCVSRFYRSYSGKITVGGISTDGLPPHKVAGLGVARTFQHVELLEGQSVLDNVVLAVPGSKRLSLVAAALRSSGAKTNEDSIRRAGERALELFGLAALRDATATSLPYGVQKLVELARAIAPNPSLLLLDEPAAGMNRDERRDLARSILRMRVNSPELAVVWVEHDVKLMGDLCDSVVALSAGSVIASGLPTRVLTDATVIEAYGAR